MPISPTAPLLQRIIHRSEFANPARPIASTRARLSSCLCNRNPWLDATTPRKIEFPLPDRRQKRLVFQACSAKMNLGDEVDLEDFVSRSEKISGAEIAAICQEAGLQAVRKNR